MDALCCFTTILHCRLLQILVGLPCPQFGSILCHEEVLRQISSDVVLLDFLKKDVDRKRRLAEALREDDAPLLPGRHDGVDEEGDGEGDANGEVDGDVDENSNGIEGVGEGEGNGPGL